MSEESNQDNNKRIAKNVGFLFFRMLLQMMVGLYTSRVVLQVLGFSDYGIYNVVGGVVVMFEFLNNSMSNATTRFLTYEIGSSNCDISLRKVFSTASFIHFVISVLLLLLAETVGLWYVNNKLVIPPDRLFATNIVYQCSIVASMISINYVPYNASIISHEKMSAFAYISIFETTANLVAVLSLKCIGYDHLIIYACLILFLKFIVCVIYIIYCKYHFKETTGQFLFDLSLLKKMASFAGWVMNGNLAVVCYTQGLNLLLNFFFNPVVNAARGIAVQVQTKIMAFCYNFQTAVNPQITKQYASQNLVYMHTLVINSSKYSFLLIFLLSWPLILECPFILSVWLGNYPPYTESFVVLTLFVGMIESLRNPINTSIHATGKIRKFQIIEGFVSLLILPLAYIFLRLGFTPVSVFVVQLVMFIALQMVRVQIVCPAIKMPIRLYYKNVILEILKVCFIPVVVMLFLKRVLLSSNEIVNFFFIISISIICTLLCIYFVGLDSHMRLKLRHFIKNKMHI